MAAITRWVQLDTTSNGTIGDGKTGCVGTRGYSTGTSSVGDTFTIGSTTNKLHLSIDGDAGPYVTLYSGTNLDPRFVAQDITNKLRDLGKADTSWDHAICRWENTPDEGNRFKIYSGTLGTDAQVAVTSGSDSADTLLGFTTKDEVGGSPNHSVGAYNFAGDISVGGTYRGFLPETYKIVVTTDNNAVRGIDTANMVKSIVYDGTFTTGGVYNWTADTVYQITIDVTNGSTQGAGTSNVPRMSWETISDGILPGSADINDDSDPAGPTELLYPDTWYNVGTKGLMVKFSDAVFAAGTWKVGCYGPEFAEGSNTTAAVGTAYVSYSSDRGDMGGAVQTSASGVAMSIGTRGVTVAFNPDNGSDYLGIRDEFFIIANGPKPSNYNISSLNYGNVTVSTESDTRCVSFEVESGAYQLSSVKFGLQSHGSFAHHDAGNSDTLFRFGTVGPGNPKNGIEWTPNITPDLIDSDTPPADLYATKANLSVVSTADDSQSIGNGPNLISDPVWIGIKLGSSETGASTCNYRLFFDYS